MSRREIVLLVSRAIALLQLIAALIDAFLYLPQQAFVLSQQLHLQSRFPSNDHLMSPMFWIGPALSIVRIVVLLLIAALFWNCGPMIERWLLPTGSTRPDEII